MMLRLTSTAGREQIVLALNVTVFRSLVAYKQRDAISCPAAYNGALLHH